MNKQVKLRIATVQDAAALLDIYAPYVENTAITFEYTVPSVREFEHRISNTLQTYPYLVAEIDNEIVGYTYASPFRERCAYQWAGEVSIYVKKTAKKPADRNGDRQKIVSNIGNHFKPPKHHKFVCLYC